MEIITLQDNSIYNSEYNFSSKKLYIQAGDNCSIQLNADAVIVCGNNCSIKTNNFLQIKTGQNCWLHSTLNHRIHVIKLHNQLYMVNDKPFEPIGYDKIDCAITIKNMQNYFK